MHTTTTVEWSLFVADHNDCKDFVVYLTFAYEFTSPQMNNKLIRRLAL